MSYSDDDLARELRRELQGNLVPFDPARAQYMIDEAIAASPVRRVLRSRWAMPLLASGAVAAVVGGVAGATALQPDGKPAHPGGGPTVSVSPSPTAPPDCPPGATMSVPAHRFPVLTTVPQGRPAPPRSTKPVRMPTTVICTISPAPTLPSTQPTLPPEVTSSVAPSAPAQPPTSVATTVPQAPTPTTSSAPVPPQASVPPTGSLTPMPGRG